MLFSRARYQLILIGDFEFYRAFPARLQRWIDLMETEAERAERRRRHGFWAKLCEAFHRPAAADEIGGGLHCNPLVIDANWLAPEILIMSHACLLPCVRFEVQLFPADPKLPTDLEQATLCFLLSDPDRGKRLADVNAFLGIGRSGVLDLLARFWRRGWVAVDTHGVISVTQKTEQGLRAGLGAISSTSDGIRLGLVFDLVGQQVASLEWGRLQSGGNVDLNLAGPHPRPPREDCLRDEVTGLS